MSLTGAGFSATFYIQAASYAGIIAGGWLADHYSSSSGRSRVLTQSLAGNRRAVSVPDRSNHLTRAADRRSADIRPRARDIRRQHHARPEPDRASGTASDG